jgi:uracil-DNA glycosylase family protein
MAQRGEIKTLKALTAAEAECTRCPLYRDATQVVPGHGPARARIMLVGEEPGDQEDRQGLPFVGPAGRLLDEALAEAGLDRAKLFITNAVKHFKFEMRGKRRLHKRPATGEIVQCRWWLDLERAIVKPKIVVAMGTSAVRGVYGKMLTIAQARGRLIALPDGAQMIVTVHPSYLLRIPEPADRHEQYRLFVRDLELCNSAS